MLIDTPPIPEGGLIGHLKQKRAAGEWKDFNPDRDIDYFVRVFVNDELMDSFTTENNEALVFVDGLSVDSRVEVYGLRGVLDAKAVTIEVNGHIILDLYLITP